MNLVGGIAVTLFSAIAGVGVLAYGAIIFGAVEAFRGRDILPPLSLC